MSKRPSLLLVGLALLAATAGALAAGKMLSVQVRQGQLREKPSFLAKVVGELAYGARVETLGTQGDWVQARPEAGGAQGWVHVSALTEKKVVLSSGASEAQVKASKEELVLAGKGFNAEVEAQYRQKHAEANYAWVDKAEKDFNFPNEALLAFVQAGQLQPTDKVKYETAAAPKPASSTRPGKGQVDP
jgi:uncharacterized protein YgiM (DUF1202 family)